MKKESRPAVGNWLDGAATCASAACLIHCLVLPLIIAALPSLAGSIDPGERFHTLLLAFAIPTSALALVPGWRSSGAVGPLACGLIGLVLLAVGVAMEGSEAAETAVTVTGSLLLAGAHLANWRLRQARCPGGSDCSC
ncbi:MerC domain-containing protein [Novosphingobium kaempferiae]|uniref:MerC domain-containing protein n=1 Tax=Novosphingobium kaempferiae TaxID=2896849 RepID=UPI001E6337A7|nr:MerC domain-containing protein [Novosphingobium kaempferiae]